METRSRGFHMRPCPLNSPWSVGPDCLPKSSQLDLLSSLMLWVSWARLHNLNQRPDRHRASRLLFSVFYCHLMDLSSFCLVHGLFHLSGWPEYLLSSPSLSTPTSVFQTSHIMADPSCTLSQGQRGRVRGYVPCATYESSSHESCLMAFVFWWEAAVYIITIVCDILY